MLCEESDTSGMTPVIPWSPVTKMQTMSHMEVDHEIMRAIPLHQALRRPELWTSPDYIRRTNRAEQVWNLSTKVSKYDVFLSHSWKTQGRWKVLALMMQMGWLHGLLGWSVGVTVVLCLRAFDIITDPWENTFWLLGQQIQVPFGPWTIIVGQTSMMLGFCLSLYLPFKTQMCFLDVACIHQGRRDMLERGVYSIGGCLAVSKELRVLYSPQYLSSLWCLFELVAFRKANPDGNLRFAPLFIEQSAVCVCSQWIAPLLVNFMLDRLSAGFRLSGIVVVVFFGAVLPIILVVHSMRYSCREKQQLISDLKTFDIDKLACSSDIDRAFLLSAIESWYGSQEAFKSFVQGKLREELMRSMPSPLLPGAYAALILSAYLVWVLDCAVSLYKIGVDGRSVLVIAGSYFAFLVNWHWFNLTAIFHLCQKCAARGQTRLHDWCKTLAVVGASFLWLFTGLSLLLAVTRPANNVVGAACYIALSMVLPFFIFNVCKRCPPHFRRHPWWFQGN